MALTMAASLQFKAALKAKNDELGFCLLSGAIIFGLVRSDGYVPRVRQASSGYRFRLGCLDLFRPRLHRKGITRFVRIFNFVAGGLFQPAHVNTLIEVIADALDTFTPEECANYIAKFRLSPPIVKML
jgi:hypothetical protein